MAGIRLALEHKADRDDVTDAIDRLTHALERLHGVELDDESSSAAERVDHDLDGPDAD
jgi:hypothetical protein